MEEALLKGLSQAQPINGSKYCRILAAKRICNLTSKQKHSLTQRAAIISLLLPMLQLHHSYATTQVSLFALLNLAFGSERNKIQIVKSGAIPILLNLLIHYQTDHDHPLQEHVLSLILILSSTAANKIPISSSGVIPLLFTIISTTTRKQTKLDALATLYNLSTSPHVIPSMLTSGSIYYLVNLIYSSVNKSTTLVETAMGILERLVSLSDIALRETAEEENSIRALVEGLEEGSVLCKEHAVTILLAICESCRERYRGMILREGAVPGLLQMSSDDNGTRVRRRSREMAQALLILLRKDDGLEKSRMNYEILEETMKQICDYDDDDNDGLGSGLRVVEETIAKLMINSEDSLIQW